MDALIEIKEMLTAVANPGRAVRMRAYMKDHFAYLGISSPDRKTRLKDLYATLRRAPKADVLTLVDALWPLAEREYQYVAMDILDLHTKTLDPSDISRVERLIQTKSWWDTVDHLAGRQIGHLFKQGQHKEAFITRWLADEDIWLNRTCLLYQLFYRDQTDWEALQYYIECLDGKRTFFIQKAIGWSLRQYSKTNDEAVRQFITSRKLSPLAEREGMKWINKNVK